MIDIDEEEVLNGFHIHVGEESKLITPAPMPACLTRRQSTVEADVALIQGSKDD